MRERAGLKAKNSVEKFRARTILFHVQRLRNLPAETATEPDAILDWLPHEAWYATRALRPGLYRVVTAVAALDETKEFDPARAAWAVRLFEEERAKLEFDLAERLAIGLYRRSLVTENVERLARVHTWRGNGEAARNLLTEALEAGPDVAAERRLYLARARLASAVLDESAALSDYGAALAFGNTDAARDLANRAVAERDLEKARFLAQVVLDESPADEEALVASGLARIPAVKHLSDERARSERER